MTRNRTPQVQADEFVAANKFFGVTAGTAVLHRNKQRSDGSPVATGVRYKLTNTKWYHLGTVACGLLPDGFPRWEGLEKPDEIL